VPEPDDAGTGEEHEGGAKKKQGVPTGKSLPVQKAAWAASGPLPSTCGGPGCRGLLRSGVHVCAANLSAVAAGCPCG
jgi:hypothetical protein